MSMSVQILTSRSTKMVGTSVFAKYMRVKIDDMVINLPELCSSKADFDKSNKMKKRLSADFFQYHVNFNKKDSIVNRIPKLLANYKQIQKLYHPRISDVNFCRGDQIWSDGDREAVLDLQLEMNTNFLSDIPFRYRNIEPNEDEVEYTNYALKEFKSRLIDLNKRTSSKTKSPTISMKSDRRVFARQLAMIDKHKFQRFNVEWASVRTNNYNWLELSKFLFNNEIWCNMTGITPRREPKTRRSNILLAVVHGVNTMGLGHPRGYNFNSSKRTAYLFNKSTFKDVAQMSGDVDEFDIKSHNLMCKTIRDGHKFIRNDTFYKNFVPSDFLVN